MSEIKRHNLEKILAGGQGGYALKCGLVWGVYMATAPALLRHVEQQGWTLSGIVAPSLLTYWAVGFVVSFAFGAVGGLLWWRGYVDMKSRVGSEREAGEQV